MFCSRNTDFRNPVGAVEEGTNIHFKILAPRNLRCSAARLYIETDRAQPVATLDLFWCGMSGQDSEWWECDYTPNEAGLYFYFFTVQTWHGECRLTRGMDGWGSLGGGAGSWQLTVYRKGFSTPDWLCGGVMYQIFPDRFCASGQPKGHIPQGRRIHTHWDEEPEWRPDAQGKVTNSDYFGGDLRGIAQKLDNLQELGVTCLYLNPVFEAHSNHRYDTACYERIDPCSAGRKSLPNCAARRKSAGYRLFWTGCSAIPAATAYILTGAGGIPAWGRSKAGNRPIIPGTGSGIGRISTNAGGISPLCPTWKKHSRRIWTILPVRRGLCRNGCGWARADGGWTWRMNCRMRSWIRCTAG